MFGIEISRNRLLWVLSAGFGLVIVLLVAAAFFGVTNVPSIRSSVAALVREQSVTGRLVVEIEREQASLNAIFYNLAGAPDSLDREQILAQLNEADAAMDRTVAAAPKDEPLWQDLKRSALRFTSEARRLLNHPAADSSSRELFRRHQQVLSIGDRLSTASYQKAAATHGVIEKQTEELLRQSSLLLGACLILALVCAIYTIRMTARLFQQMEWQAGELSRVSWHMLENQETSARRFSHELHDELGQSLTAVKANLLALRRDYSQNRVEDCLRLVDETIDNVRQLSQLMRPTILDDFGLDAGLRWLAEGFTQRTGIEVAYTSNFEGRLSDENETHLFRIAQEALTNVARHSSATNVILDLHRVNGKIALRVADNGRGLPPQTNRTPRAGLGITGIRARARISGGEMKIHSESGAGVVIEVWMPV